MSGVTPGQVMAVLADLAPEGRGGGPDGRPVADLAIPKSDSLRVPLAELAVLRPLSIEPDAESAKNHAPLPGPTRVSADAMRLVTRAKLHEEGRLRLGWLWVRGTTANGAAVRFPLVSAPVSLSFGGRRLLRAGDVEVTDLIVDPDERARLEATLEFGGGALDGEQAGATDPALLSRLSRLAAWAADAAAAAGFPGADLAADPPDRQTDEPGAVVVAQLHLYLAEPPKSSATIAGSLRSWAAANLGGTAFAHVYTDDGADDPPARAAGPEPVESSIVLSSAQRSAVATARSAPVTVVSGPPGTGKTQTIAAIALDAIERGESVLIGAPSPAAVEALIALLTDVPGPDPLVFGATAKREEVAARLGQGGGRRVSDDELGRAEQRHRTARAAYHQLHTTIRELLLAEQLAARTDPALTLYSRQATPSWFDPDADLAEAGRLLERAGQPLRGLFGGYRRGRRLAKLQAHAGTSSTDLATLGEHLSTARAVRAAGDLTASGGLDLAGLWDRLAAADEARRLAKAEWLNAVAHSERRAGRRGRGTMGAVSAALRAGRATRRQMLGRIDGAELTRALPLWVGTLRDIDDLLPRSPAMFDVAILDEASQVDQVSAAPALVRAKRAVVVGDPKQLRHVSFVADERIATALDANGVTDADTAGRLDVRRLSAFDVAASVAPVRFLDEHFRSLPHLVEFSAKRFYRGELAIATRHPRNDDLDCISVRPVAGARTEQGHNPAELSTVLDLIRERFGRGQTVGVVSPFRGQIDALEARLVVALDDPMIDDLALRIGTVHGFQGCERDVLIVTLAIDPSAPAGAMRFLADENLFNVMITRARHEIVVVTSLGTDAPGLVGEYLRHAGSPPHPPAGNAPGEALARRVAGDLARSAATVVTGYPAGRHTIDIVAGAGSQALGVLFGVHPDGPEAHVERHLALRRAGWELREVYATRWGDQPEALAVELALEAQRRTPPWPAPAA